MDTTSDERRGLECPKCGCRTWRVTNTWLLNGRIKRRRVCRHCGRPMNTYETVTTPKK